MAVEMDQGKWGGRGSLEGRSGEFLVASVLPRDAGGCEEVDG